MADTKISGLASLTNPDPTDVLPIVDTSASTTKKIAVSDLLFFTGSLHKTGLTNNTDNPIFSFPLNNTEAAGFTLMFVVRVLKNNTDHASATGFVFKNFYNNNGVLEASDNSQYFDNDQGVASAAGASFVASLSSNVVTVKFNPGDVIATGTTINLDYVIFNPQNITITAL